KILEFVKKYNFKFRLFVGTSPHTPSSFATEGSACGIGTKNQKDCIFDTNLGFTSHFKQNLIIFYTINKEKLHLRKSKN
ncbi:hypothetical protein, partial [Brachyspira pulli]|uniref:hypothetical protein n=1 Tax=Brachyspira pulli TaxID=310721 RepID=UPI0030042993